MGKRMQECCWKCCYIPQRVILALMGAAAVITSYTSRVCLNIAITQMVVPHNRSVDMQSCPRDESQSKTSTKDVSELYVWTEVEQGIILGSFYVGYVLSHVPGGILSDKFGGKHVLGGGVIGTVVLTVLFPLIIKSTDGNWIAIVCVRLGQGLSQGVVFPALTTLLAKWVPKRERATLGTLVYCGNSLGTILSNYISGNLMHIVGTWTVVFYLWGALGLIWVIFWYLMCFSYPNTNPYIRPEEIEYLEREIGPKKVKKKIPWGPIMKSAPNWALIFAQVGHAWGLFTVISDLPKYMNDVLQLNIKKNALWTSVPYALFLVVSLGAGFLCDWLINKGHLKVTVARKVFTTVASAGPSTFLIVAAYVGCNQIAAGCMFTIAMGLMGFFYSGLKVNAMDLSPNFAGTLMALNNGIGGITGFAAPAIIGVLTPNHTLQEWRVVFWITFAIMSVTNVIFIVWASGHVQWWNDQDTPPPKGEAATSN